MRIYLPRTVTGDWPIGHHLVAERGYHEAVKNKNGAVSVVLPSGLLGVKPDEFIPDPTESTAQIDTDSGGSTG